METRPDAGSTTSPLTALPPAEMANGRPLTLKSVLRAAEKLLPVPRVAQRAQAAMREGKSLHAVGTILATDSSISTTLIRLANSAHYRGAAETLDVPSAVVRIGGNRLSDILTSLAVIKPCGKEKKIAAGFRQLMVTNGASARVIALYLERAQPDPAFLVGLLCDVGQLLLALVSPVHYGVIVTEAAQSGKHVREVEQAWAGFSHDELGAQLLEAWLMPRSVIEGVRFHHRLAAAMLEEDDDTVVQSAVAALASRVGSAISGLRAPADGALEGILACEPQRILQLSEEVAAGLAEECKQASFELGAVFAS